MKIEQVYVSPTLQFFANQFREKFQLQEYHDVTKPAVFFGCYKQQDIAFLLNHKSVAVLIWGGSDALKISTKYNLYERILKRKNIKHIAISSFVRDDLLKHSILPKMFPITPMSTKKFELKPLGGEVYWYSSKLRSEFYGDHIVEEIKDQMPQFNFIRSTAHSVPFEKIHEIYERAFIGLRLTPHDGCSNTVMEMGLMGRKCIWNGESPNAIKWKSKQDVINAINKESKRIGYANETLVKKMKKYLTLPEKWLHTQFYD